MPWIYRMLDWLRHRARRPHLDPAHALGKRGEDLAHRYLQRQGYTIVGRNFRTRSGSGEVDLIGWKGEVLAFVEVKSRSSAEYGDPERAVDAEKRHKLLIAAREYTRRAHVDWSKVRFDVLSIVFPEPAQITLFEDAFAKRDDLRSTM